MASEAQLKAQDKYDSKNTKQFKMKLNVKTDADILEWLDKQVNKQGAIKDLIRREINGQKHAMVKKPAPAVNKFIVEGEFINGAWITVSIDGKEFRRKVYISSKNHEPVIIIYGNEYAKSEFNGGN